jgi:hypothetical protein
VCHIAGGIVACSWACHVSRPNQVMQTAVSGGVAEI